MSVDFHRAAKIQDVFQTAGMVVMPMAQHYGVGLLKIDTKDFGVMFQSKPLPRIEKDFLLPEFQPEGQPMFREQASRSGGVFH